MNGILKKEEKKNKQPKGEEEKERKRTVSMGKKNSWKGPDGPTDVDDLGNTSIIQFP